MTSALVKFCSSFTCEGRKVGSGGSGRREWWRARRPEAAHLSFNLGHLSVLPCPRSNGAVLVWAMGGSMPERESSA